MTRLEEIKERCEKATQGPWVSDEYNVAVCSPERRAVCDVIPKYPEPEWEKRYGCSEWPENNVFIAHSRSDIPWLISQLEKAIEVVKCAQECGCCRGTIAEQFLEQLK